MPNDTILIFYIWSKLGDISVLVHLTVLHCDLLLIGIYNIYDCYLENKISSISSKINICHKLFHLIFDKNHEIIVLGTFRFLFIKFKTKKVQNDILGQ